MNKAWKKNILNRKKVRRNLLKKRKRSQKWNKQTVN